MQRGVDKRETVSRIEGVKLSGRQSSNESVFLMFLTQEPLGVGR